MGDYNQICLHSEVLEGTFAESRAMKMLDECNFLNLGASSSKFTCERKDNGRRVLTKRLNIGLGDIV